MPLAKCPRCEKLYDKVSAIVCQNCIADEEADYEKVRALLEESPELTAEAACAKAQIDVAVVKRMLEQGIVAFKSGAGKVTCGMCGAPAISVSKRLCQTCLDKLNAQVIRAQSQVKLSTRQQPDIGLGSAHKTFDEKRRT